MNASVPPAGMGHRGVSDCECRVGMVTCEAVYPPRYAPNYSENLREELKKKNAREMAQGGLSLSHRLVTGIAKQLLLLPWPKGFLKVAGFQSVRQVTISEKNNVSFCNGSCNDSTRAQSLLAGVFRCRLRPSSVRMKTWYFAVSWCAAVLRFSYWRLDEHNRSNI